MNYRSFNSIFFGVVSFFVLGFGISANAQDLPTLKIGDTRTYVKKDGFNGRILEERTYVVSAVTTDGYTINQTSSASGATTFNITKNLGQNSPVDGKVGDGNLYDFPLTKGKTWKSTSYWSSQYGLGSDEMEYTVVGEEQISTPAGTFSAIKITGKGYWRLNSGAGGGTLESISFYSPVVKNTVKYERTLRASRTQDRDILELTSFKNSD